MSFFESLRHGVEDYVTFHTYDLRTDPDIVSSERSETLPTHSPVEPPLQDEHTTTVHALLNQIDGYTPTGRLAALAGEHNGSVSREEAIESGISPKTIDLLTAYTGFFHQEDGEIEVISFQKRAVDMHPVSNQVIANGNR